MAAQTEEREGDGWLAHAPAYFLFDSSMEHACDWDQKEGLAFSDFPTLN